MKYEDILEKTRPRSSRPKMSGLNRAAQFAPFAALTGYEQIIEEAGRVTETQIELSEEEKQVLNDTARFLMSLTGEMPMVRIVYWQEDHYETCQGYLKRIDDVNHCLYLKDRKKIALDQILRMEIL